MTNTDANAGSWVLRRAQLADGSPADVAVRDGRIDTVGSVDHDDEGGVVVDLDGYLLLPAAVEPHAHLDKAFLADVVTNETGDLMGAIDAMDRARDRLNLAETVARAERAARLMAANGFRAVRTHADVTVGNGLRSIEAMVEVRRRVADVIDVQIVALAGTPLMGPEGGPTRSLMRDAVDAGADLVGGCPHLEAHRDPGYVPAATEFLLDLAVSTQRGVDLHTDENLDPTTNGLADLAQRVLGTGFAHPVTASHCVNLSMRPEAEQRRVAELVARAGISVVALPVTNLYLQGRDQQQAMPRGVTAVKALRDAGVNLAAGADNLQDPFNPVGKACPFETAWLLTVVAHQLPADAWHAVTHAAATAIGAPDVRIEAGAPADLVAIRATSLREAIATGSPDRIVWRHGHRL
ncbi:amidohydrolase family protein [soil metagenome]